MAQRDTFTEDFKKLLESIPDSYSLPKWQFAYRQVLYLMGMKILQNFPSDVVGPDPSGLQAPGPRLAQNPGNPTPAGGGGQTGGGHPSVICELACAALGVSSPAGKNPPPGPQ
jgi:hypothetical protein